MFLLVILSMEVRWASSSYLSGIKKLACLELGAVHQLTQSDEEGHHHVFHL